MSEHVFFITISLPLATILAVFGMRYFAAVKEARLRFASDEAYRQLAEKSAAAQAETAQALASISATLSEVRTRVTVIEKVLKEVD
jgi:hypothetical protein